MNSVQLIDKRNSLVLRGGILLMLVHHLFYSEASQLRYDDLIVHGYGLVNQIGIFSKLCVAIFVFISGYGLATKYRNGLDLKQFYTSRFKKLYLNYWFIWLIFVPIGVFVFHRTLADVYGQHVAIKGILEFFGVLNLTGHLGYNPTWWFYSCIIVLYMLFPWLNRQFERSPYLLATIGIFASFIAFLPFVQPYSNYMLTFLVGMLMARKPELFQNIGIKESVASLLMLCLMRNFCGNLTFIVDTLICVGLAMLLYRISLPKWYSNVMENLGEHSMNIFLFHTFIYLYWFRVYIYNTQNPILIFFSLLIPCYLMSVLIEVVKSKIGFNRLLK